MQSLVDIQKLIQDRDAILKLLSMYKIEVLKIESKSTKANSASTKPMTYIISLGGINKILFEQNKNDVEEKLGIIFKNNNFIFK